ncbi:DUF6197 family protein (plasmid) [Kitasatospora sp. NBC_00374]|uniref:DUF6197 family protein n=1 Tax=Kitasatospora sp. NBC_00374 TaxID=2975964 RepID=UPI002F90D6BF
MSRRTRITRTQLVMELTARRLQESGLHQGAALSDKEWESYPPSTFAPGEPCSVLHAFDRAQRKVAGRTIRTKGRQLGVITPRRSAHHPGEFSEALRVLSDHLAEEPITPAVYGPLGLSETDYRRTVIASWSKTEGLTAKAAAQAIRSAVGSHR